MKLLKMLLILSLVLGVISVGLVLAAPTVPIARNLVEKLHLTALQPVADALTSTTGQIQSQVPQVKSLINIQAEVPASSSSGSSLPQRTFEYVRYAYCQQVVQDYEKQNGINQTTTKVSPSPMATPVATPTATPAPSPSPSPKVSPKPTSSPVSNKK